uniref:hypothetical protein n=1 Tax=Pedobacter schmidteae TaxID=2201271 RepID=UPI000EAF2162|nr:hypothetical protein [Pedobacter schmidteae]
MDQAITIPRSYFKPLKQRLRSFGNPLSGKLFHFQGWMAVFSAALLFNSAKKISRNPKTNADAKTKRGQKLLTMLN